MALPACHALFGCPKYLRKFWKLVIEQYILYVYWIYYDRYKATIKWSYKQSHETAQCSKVFKECYKLIIIYGWHDIAQQGLVLCFLLVYSLLSVSFMPVSFLSVSFLSVSFLSFPQWKQIFLLAKLFLSNTCNTSHQGVV